MVKVYIEKIFIIIAIAIMSFAASSIIHAEEVYQTGEKIGDLYYELDKDNMTATVVRPPYREIGYGDITYEYLDPYEGEIIVPETVISEGKEYTVNVIGEKAFVWQEAVTSVVLPNTITEIRNYALYATNITSITIPSSVKYIGIGPIGTLEDLVYNAVAAEIEGVGENYNPFRGSMLRKLTIGEEVKVLDGRTFRNYTKLTELHYNAIDCEISYDFETTYFHKSPFPESLKKVIMGDKVRRISPYLLCNIGNVEDLELSDSIEYIGEYAFFYCGTFSSLTVPKSVTYMGTGAFACGPNLVDIIYNAENCAIEKIYDVEGEFGFNIFPLNQIEKVTIGNNVKCLPAGLFARSKITQIIIPNSVEHIYPYALYACWNLKEVVMSERVDSIDRAAFAYCGNIESITLPQSLKSIGEKAFVGCKNVASMSIPQNVESIGMDAFDGCANLKELIYNPIECKLYTSKSPFPTSMEKLIIGDKVKSIPAYAFRTTRITSVVFPRSVEIIGEHSFENTNLNSITFSNSIKKVGKQAFNCCSLINEVNAESLKSWLEIEFEDVTANPTTFSKSLVVDGESIPRRLVIPDGVTRIGSYAFSNWESIVSVSIPESVTSVGTYAFSGCSGLQRAIFTSLESFLSMHYESEKCLIPGVKYINDEPLDQTYITIPEKMTRIPDFTFYNWTNLSKINISEDVTYIGKYAFGRCTALDEIVIPSKVDTIAEGAFSRSKIRLVSIPKSIRYIGPRAFDMDTYWSDISDIWSPKYTNVDIQSINNWTKIEFADELANPIAILKRFTINGEKVKHLDLEAAEDSISSYAFINATDLLSVRISAISIGESAFKGCKNIENLCISANNICETSFSGTQAIKNIYVPRSIPPVALNNSFSKYDGVNLYVPEGALKAYENAENCWWKFLDVYESDFKDLDEIFKADYGNILVQSIQLTPDSWSGEEGESFTIDATVLPDNATDKSLLWSSSDESVATVNSEGLVTVLKEGNCVIKATAADGSGVYAECVVTGLAGIEEIFAETDSFDVYDLNGILIKKNSDRESLKHLTSGIYIVRVGKTMKKLVIR